MDFNKAVEELSKLNFKNMYEGDFFLTWDKTDDEIKAVWEVADALRALRERNISTKVFDSGLGISLFRDNSTRTRFSFAYLDLKFKTLMKVKARLLMVRQLERLQI